MFDVMSVRLRLSGVRVLEVGFDNADRLVVGVVSVRDWARCRHCGFKRYKVGHRRAKRVRDLGVSGRRTMLVWQDRLLGDHEARLYERLRQDEAHSTYADTSAKSRAEATPASAILSIRCATSPPTWRFGGSCAGADGVRGIQRVAR